jgi:Tol biopolymer transport system component
MARLLRASAATWIAVFALGAPALAGEVRFAGEGHAYHPVWSIDGKYVAYEVNRYAGDVDLYMSQVNGDIAKDGVKVTLPGGGNAFGGSGQVVVNPVWHKDGIAVFEGSNQGGQFRLYYHNPGGGAAAELISTTELDGDLTFPTVAPDGKTMGFISDKTGNGDVRTRDTQSNQLSQLTQTSSAEMFPSFSSDGARMLFTRKADGAEDVFEVTVGTGAEKGLASGNGDQTRPAYAKGHIVFFDGSRGEDNWDLVSMSDSGTKKTLARGVRLPLRSRPAVSPNGEWVAYTFQDPGQGNKVLLTKVDGSKTVEVTTEFTACGEPAIGVQGDRTLLAFTALPNSGSDWRFLYIKDVSDQLL